MEKVIVETINGMRQITARYNEEFKSVSFEENTVLHDGKQFTISRIVLRKADVEAMLAYFDELENFS